MPNTLDELLGLSDEVVDKTITVDNELRTITVPKTVKNLGVESDDDVHRLHFKLPRYCGCGEVDLSEFKIRVNYRNAKNGEDVYEVEDAAVVVEGGVNTKYDIIETDEGRMLYLLDEAAKIPDGCTVAGNYTDTDGQAWLCNTINLNTNVKTHYVDSVVFRNGLYSDVSSTINGTVYRVFYAVLGSDYYSIVNYAPSNSSSVPACIYIDGYKTYAVDYMSASNVTVAGHYITDKYTTGYENAVGYYKNGSSGMLYIAMKDFINSQYTTANAYLSSNPLTIWYALNTVLTEELTDEDVTNVINPPDEEVTITGGTEYITFSWLVGRNAFIKAGNVTFSICLMKYAADGIEVVKEFNTTTTTLPVLPGLETAYAIVQKHEDILEQWHIDLDQIQVDITNSNNTMASIREDITEANTLITSVTDKLSSVDNLVDRATTAIEDLSEKMLWYRVGTSSYTANQSVTLPSEFVELSVHVNLNGTDKVLQLYVLNEQLYDTGVKSFSISYFNSPDDYGSAKFTISKKKITLVTANINTTNVLKNTTWTVWHRSITTELDAIIKAMAETDLY